MFNLKKKVKNKAYVKDLICKAYIDEEISIFILYYFKSHLRTRINCIPKYDDSEEVLLNGNLSIFFYPGWPLPENAMRGRYLSCLFLNHLLNWYFLKNLSINIKLIRNWTL